MINSKDIYSGKIKAGQFFVVTATKEKVFITDFMTASIDGKRMTAITNDKRFFSIADIDLCTG